MKSDVQFARAEQELALVRYQQTIQTAFREVSDALVQYRRVKEIRTQQELLVATLRDRSRLAHVRYEGGIDNLLNALDADRELFAAELDLARPDATSYCPWYSFTRHWAAVGNEELLGGNSRWSNKMNAGF